jgi:ferritin-like metal-binding protein YciE
MAKINTIKDVLLTKLQALYDTEVALEKALPKMEKAAHDPDLKEGFSDHLKETQEHSRRLEQIFKMLETKPKKLSSDGIKGIIQDGEWVMNQDAKDSIGDIMLASAARYAEHFEMAGYLSAISLAEYLDLDDVVELLSETLSEEEEADEKLTEAIDKSLELSKANMADEDETDEDE